jgi:tetratricopeptide (TPR) repeat protein
MTRASFPEIPAEALRSHAQPERVERVWRRLQLDVTGTSRPRSFAYAWASLAALGIFATGIAVGSRLRAPLVDVTAVAEPRAALPVPGAGPAVEPQARAAHRAEAPAQKRARTPRTLPTGETASEQYLPETYGDPVSVAESAPVAAVEFAEWEKLAEAGDFRAAKDALDREGGFERAAQRSSASQLMVLADIARASGSREQAAQALKRVLSAYSSAPEAPVAAWTLGNLLEQAGDRAGAADAYATYRRLSPTGDFAEDAAARQVDAALSQGNLELGRRTLEEYAQNFPKGRRLAELRKRLTALEAPADTSAAAPSEPDDDDDSTEPAAAEPAAPPAAAREH